MPINRKCDQCGTEYSAQARYLNRGQGLFCSKECAAENNSIRRIERNKLARINNVVCAICNTEFYVTPTRLKNSKSKLYFCSKAHKDSAQKIGGIAQILPSHYGKGEGKHDYRKRALEFYSNQCQNCSWNKFPDLLEVNHRDINRDNNKIENLEVLCPTCHRLFHWITSTGGWNNKLSSKPYSLDEANQFYYRDLSEYFIK